ncbi:MAG: M48 family metalloprotease [Candidatus Heimdallarchaeota archaeon]
MIRAHGFTKGQSSQHAIYVVHTSSLKRLEDSEIEAILAHKINHIRIEDVLSVRIAAIINSLITWVVR